MTTEETKATEAAESLVKAAIEGAKSAEPGQIEEPVIHNIGEDDRLFVNFEMLTAGIKQGLTQLSQNAMRRVFIASLVAPFKDPPRFINPVEEKIFNMVVKSFDLKMALIGKMLRDHEAEEESILAQAKAEAEKAKESNNVATEATGGENNG